MGGLKFKYLKPKAYRIMIFSISSRQIFGTKWLVNDVGPSFSRLQILLADVHPNRQSSNLSEAGYLYQAKLPTGDLDIKISFV